jgi:oligoendopeptidase F
MIPSCAGFGGCRRALLSYLAPMLNSPRIAVVALACSVVASPALTAAAPVAAERPPVVWDLAPLYPSVETWEAARAQIAADIPKIATYRGTLGQGAGRLKELLDLVYGLRKEMSRLSIHASLKADENLREPSANERRALAQQLSSHLARATSWINPELLELGDDRIYTYLQNEPGLAEYRYPIMEVLRRRPHTLGAEAEQVLSASHLVTGNSGEVYGILTNSDIPWPQVTLSTGEEVTLDAAGYVKHRAAPHRDDRKLVFDTFWAAYKTYENTFGTTFAGMINRDIFYARARNYPNTLQAALSPNAIPEAVYRTLLAEVGATLPTLHRYFQLRGRMLRVEQPRYYDIYPDLVHLDKPFPFEEGRRLSIASAAPLGSEYTALLAEAMHGDWTHLYPQPGKRSGAYMSGGAYDVHPYVLMNYQDNYESVSTLAHEWGHGMHSILANRHQPYPTAGYGIFTAEIASVVNEVLLLEHMLKEAQSDDERLYYLGSALEGMRGTYFRQAMFAEFELRAHEVVEEGGALTGARLTKLYGDLLRRYHGHDEGVVAIDDLYAIEWAYIPHFYRGYYVYQYATSMAAANLFADRILAGEPGAVETYLGLLRAGGSDSAYELVKRAGVDLATAAPYRSVAARMNRIMDQMEEILARQAVEAE